MEEEGRLRQVPQGNRRDERRRPGLRGRRVLQVQERQVVRGVDPVSYTHLDVYKRQGAPSAWAATRPGTTNVVAENCFSTASERSLA